ncbi:Ribonuclease BN [subsurface metagenome]
MKITIIYDNEVWEKGLRADWGFSCLVDAYERKILFDTGSNGFILLENMKKLNIEPEMIQEVFISHAHFDHTGGLPSFLEANPVKTYIPSSCPQPSSSKEVVKVKESLYIHDNIFSTGEIKNVEQSLVVKTENGTVLVVGCSHSGVNNILKTASQFGKPYAIIGGLHGFRDFGLIKDLKFICPIHCTQFKSKIKKLYPEKYIEGGVGKVIEL